MGTKSSDTSTSNNHTCVLLSGGIDSTACLDYYVSKGSYVQAVYVKYGQLSEQQEFLSCEKIASYYNLELKVLDFRGSGRLKKDFICGRNAFLLMAALMEFPDVNTIALGIHAGTSYSDCSSDFIEQIQGVFDLYSMGAVQISTPFIKWSKAEIWDYCKVKNVPVELTYSCEYGRKQPCGECLSCKDLEALNAS